MMAQAVPEGWHTVTPRLFVAAAAKLVDFLKHAFGVSGSFRNDGPSEIHIADSIVLVSEAGVRDAMPAFLYLYLDDTDGAYRRALRGGATVIEEPRGMFYGDRRATVKDPFGNIWQIATHKEDLTLEKSGEAPRPRGIDDTSGNAARSERLEFEVSDNNGSIRYTVRSGAARHGALQNQHWTLLLAGPRTCCKVGHL
jgi:PhnB protein